MSTPALQGVPAVHGSAEEMFCLVLGHERIPHAALIEGGRDEVVRLPLTAFLIKSPDGWFLFDVGLGEGFARDEAQWGKFYLWGAPELPGPGDPLLEALAQCGVAPGDLAGVVVSHMHLDHTGGLPHFQSGPPIYVQRAELEYAMSEIGPQEAAYWPADYASDKLRWELLDGDAQIATGITAFSTPGHSAGHMSYLVDLPESGRWLLAFDAVPTQENVDRDAPINTGSREVDKPQRQASHRRVLDVAAATGARIVGGHCSTTWPNLLAPPRSYR